VLPQTIAEFTKGTKQTESHQINETFIEPNSFEKTREIEIPDRLIERH
jgi:hypothetical protein